LITAWSAEEGIKLADTHIPQLIFLDINLPCMSGREAITHLLDNPKLQSTTIIALSADFIPHHIQSALSLGFHDYITKPIDLSHFKIIIEKLFNPGNESG
jgi:CheY-like chemotaxis protein